MVMRIKRFTGLQTQYREILERIQEELGKDAHVQERFFREGGGMLGIGGRRMVEVIAMVDDTPQEPRRQRRKEPQPEAPPATREFGSAPDIAEFIRLLDGVRKEVERDLQLQDDAPLEEEEPVAAPPPPPPAEPVKEEWPASTQPKFSVLKRPQIEKIETPLRPPVRSDDWEAKLVDIQEEILDHLISREVDKPIAMEIVQSTLRELTETRGEIDNEELIEKLFKAMTEAVRSRDNGGGEDDSPGPHVEVFVGPTGVGKTTTLAKLAATRAFYDKKRVALVTSDTYRIAAVEQLRKYGSIMGLPLEVVFTDDELKPTLEKYSGYDTILIDTAGRSPLDRQKMDKLSKLLDRGENLKVHLCLSATTKLSDLKEIIRRYEEIGFSDVVITKIDETTLFGTIFSLLYYLKAPILCLTNGQEVPDDIILAPDDVVKGMIVQRVLK